MKTYFYVYRLGDAAPKVRHATLTAATQEAERLAAKHPGAAFEILQCLAISQVARARTFWLDGVRHGMSDL